MADPNLLDDEEKAPAKEAPKAPEQKPANPSPTPSQPAATNGAERVAIRDWQGEIWPLNTPMGRMLENTALGEGVRPDYVTQSEIDALNKKGPELLNTDVATDNKSKQAPSGSFYQQGLLPVKKMQQALINLSKDIASHNIMNVEDRTTTKGHLLNGSNAFLNFLVTSYANTAKTTGKQLVDTDEKQPVRMDTAKINDNFKGMLNTINRIGTPGTEKAPDGNWGPRTNNALKQIYSLAYTLSKVAEDMGIELSRMYTEQDLAELYTNIPAEPNQINLNEKLKRAEIIASNLDKLRGLYDSFREKIFNNPTYNAHISQAKPLFVRDNSKPIGPALNKYEQSLYEKHKSTELDVSLNGQKVTIMPFNLLSMDNFKKFLNSKAQMVGIAPEQLDAINKGDKMLLNKFLMEVSDGLGKE